MIPRLTEDEAIHRINALPDVQFVKWVADYESVRKSVAVVLCTKHNQEFTCSATRLLAITLVATPKCPTCMVERRKAMKLKRLEKSDKEIIEKCLSTGKYAEGYKFIRNSRTNSQGGRIYWNVYCPKCAEDAYSKAGVGGGWFETSTRYLLACKIPCRCAPRKTLTPEQWEFRAREEVKTREHLTFLSIGEGTTWGSRKIYLHCDLHGDFDCDLFNFLPGGGCPSCATTGFDKSKPSALYIIKAESVGDSFTGYGISNTLDQRLSTHRRNLAYEGFAISDHSVFHMDGHTAFDTEKLLKLTFPVYSQDVSGFRREATYADHYLDVVRLVQNSLATRYER